MTHKTKRNLFVKIYDNLLNEDNKIPNKKPLSAATIKRRQKAADSLKGIWANLPKSAQKQLTKKTYTLDEKEDKRSARDIIKNKICMFCGKPLGEKREVSSWYRGCHAACLKKYNRNRQ